MGRQFVYFSPLFIKLTAEDCRQIYESNHLFTSLTLLGSSDEKNKQYVVPALQKMNKNSRKGNTLPQQDICPLVIEIRRGGMQRRSQ